MAELAKLTMNGAGSSWAAKKLHPTAAIIGAADPSDHPVVIQIVQVTRMVTNTPTPDSSAMPWSRWRIVRAAAV